MSDTSIQHPAKLVGVSKGKRKERRYVTRDEMSALLSILDDVFELKRKQGKAKKDPSLILKDVGRQRKVSRHALILKQREQSNLRKEKY